MKRLAFFVLSLSIACGGAAVNPEKPIPEARGPLPEGAEAYALTNDVLRAPDIEPTERTKRKIALLEARAKLEEEPESLEATVWVGRRLAYIHRYRDAISHYTEALGLHKDNPILLRHRGHRYITLRELGAAERDLAKAADLVAGTEDAVEADGQPNAAGIPTSTLHANIHYHLGLARYLQGKYAEAADAYRASLAAAHTDDMRVAASYWLYLSLRDAGQAAAAEQVVAPLTEEMTLYENHTYHLLLRMYRGDVQVAEVEAAMKAAKPLEVATVGYGLARWYVWQGQTEKAEKTFEKILESPMWPAFGYLAAEAYRAREK